MTEKQFIRTITVLPVHDITVCSEWYEKALGLETVYLHEGDHEDEPTNYAVMVRDGVYVHLILDEPPPHDAAWTKAGSGYLYLHVRNIDEMYAEVVSRGVEVTLGLETEVWGARAFNLTDPSGNTIHVEQE